MVKNSIPLKVAIGYGIVAIVLALAIYLVYSNAQTILNINHASQEYSRQREKADSVMTGLLAGEQANLQKLTSTLETDGHEQFLHKKVNSLNSGKDSVVVSSKSPQTHQAKQTTVEVVKTRKGFFHRVADIFKKEHTDTIRVTQDESETTTDSVTTPIDVTDEVADALTEIGKEEKQATQGKKKAMAREITDLQAAAARLALQSNEQMTQLRQQEKASLQQALDQALEAHRQLLWQISLLAMVAMAAAIVLLLHIWRDTRRTRLYQENLQRAKDETQRVMEQRERLLLTITHDIKAPAASISGFVNLLREEVTQPKVLAYIDSIRHSASHLSQLVATLLDYHQLENGLMKVQPVSFSPAMLLKQCVESMQPRAKEKGLYLSCETNGSTSLYQADAFRIRQILDNLVGNAIKYTDHGSIQVGCLVEEDGDGKQRLILTVRDTGRGMTTEECQNVFNAFTRLKESQGIEGVGLGLAITHELTTLLRGEIRLRSEKGKGSAFTVLLPVEKSETEAEERPVEPTTFSNKKVLILDDDKLQLQLLGEMLRRVAADWQVFACNRVGEALTVLHNEQPALMLADIEMPEMNGMELIRHINHSRMKVIAMTAHDASILPQLRQAGFDDCLFKPFDREKLARILTRPGTPCPKEEKGEETTPQSRFAPLLSFAEGDKKAEQEILSNLRQELAKHLENLKEAIRGETAMDTTSISQTAHKLQPIAKMLQFSCIEPLIHLSPEHIQEQGEREIKENLRAVTKDLEDILAELKESSRTENTVSISPCQQLFSEPRQVCQ